MDTLILIPVKTTSKRLPQKNTRFLCNKSMFGWVFDEAIQTEIGSVFISTENDELSDACFSEMIPTILRPKELAEDPNGIDEVAIHALTEIDHFYKDLIILQADNPLTLAEDIEGAYSLYKLSGKSVTSVVDVGYGEPVYGLGKHGYLERMYDDIVVDGDRNEYYGPLCRKTGAITIISVDEFLENKTRHVSDQLGYLLPKERAVDVDTEWDFLIAETLLKRRLQ